MYQAAGNGGRVDFTRSLSYYTPASVVKAALQALPAVRALGGAR